MCIRDRLMNRLVDEAAQRRPSLAVLVDSPDFNLRLARRLGGLGIPVVLYVSPQLWAWRQGRVHKVRRLAREVLCILPFETDFYRHHGVPVRYVGHPLVDDLAGEETPEGRSDRRLALLPGSRSMEVRNLLPAMLRALSRLPGDLVSEAVLVEAPGMADVITEVLGGEEVDGRLFRVAGERRRGKLGSCGAAWTASGTATLECALLDVPMIVGYRLKRLSWWLAKRLVKVPHAALANLIAGGPVVPELLQNEWNADRISDLTCAMLRDGGFARQRRHLAVIRERLGEPGASECAARAVLEHIRRPQIDDQEE